MADLERDTPTPRPIPAIPEPPRLKSASLPELGDEPAQWNPGSGSGSAGPPPGWVITEPQGELPPTSLFETTALAYPDTTQPPDDGRPLISILQPMTVLREEYEQGNPVFIHQIDWLQTQGYLGVRRAKGDGDCFYRALAFAYISQLLESSDQDLSVTTALALLESQLDMFKHPDVGFHEIVYEDFYDTFTGLIKSIIQPQPDMPKLTPQRLLEAFNDAETSNSIVVYLRLLTSAEIRLNAESYEGFLFHPETDEMLTPVDFCIQFVEPVNKEADEVHIRALTRALHLNVEVAYLDGRGNQGSEPGLVRVNFVKVENVEDHTPIRLLYRPGHYDILDNRSSMPEEHIYVDNTSAGLSTGFVGRHSVGAAKW